MFMVIMNMTIACRDCPWARNRSLRWSGVLPGAQPLGAKLGPRPAARD